MASGRGVYNFLVNMSVNFNKTSKVSAAMGNIFRNLNIGLQNTQKQAQKTANTIKATAKELGKETTERADYFHTVWGRLFGLMMKFYTLRFVIQFFYNLGNAIYKASSGVDDFSIKLKAMLGNGKYASDVLGELNKKSREYGVSLKNIAKITKSLKGIKQEGLLDALLQLENTKGYGAETVDIITKALEKMRDTGKVSITDINNIAEQGVYVWEEIQTQLGLTDEQLRHIEKSGVDVNLVMNAISDAVKKTADMNKAQINETQKSLERLKMSFAEFAKILSTAVPADNIFKSIFNWLTSIIKSINLAIFKIKYLLSASSKDKLKIFNYKEIDTIFKNITTDLENRITSIIYEANKKLLPSKQIPFLKENIDPKKLDEFTQSLNAILTEIYSLFGNDVEKAKEFIAPLVEKYFGLAYNREMAKKMEKYLGKGVIDDLVREAINYVTESISNLFSSISKSGVPSTPTSGAPNINTQEEPKINTPAEEQRPQAQQKKLDINFLNDILEEIIYNFHNAIENNLDGVLKQFEEIIGQMDGIGVYNLDNIETLKLVFKELEQKTVEYYSKQIETMQTMGSSEDEINKKRLEEQSLLKKQQEALNKLIDEVTEKIFKATVEEEKSKAEQERAKFWNKTLLNISKFFKEGEKEIKIISETGTEFVETIASGLPVISDQISNILSKFPVAINFFSKAFENISTMIGYLSKGELDNNMALAYMRDAIANIFGGIGMGLQGLLEHFSENILSVIGGGLLTALAEVPNIEALLDPLTYMIQVLADYLLPTINDLLQPLIGFITTIAIKLAEVLMPILSGLMPFFQAFADYLALLLTALQPFINVFGLIFQQVVQALLVPLMAIFTLMTPILQALIPVFKFFAKILYWVGFVVNGVVNILAGVVNALIDFINWVTGKNLPKIKVQQYQSWKSFQASLNATTTSTAQMVQNASNPTNEPTATAGESAGISGNYTTTQQRPITVNVNVENWFGDETATRKLALIVKNEFEVLGVI